MLSSAWIDLMYDKTGEGQGWLCHQQEESVAPVSCATLYRSLPLQVSLLSEQLQFLPLDRAGTGYSHETDGDGWWRATLLIRCPGASSPLMQMTSSKCCLSRTQSCKLLS